MGETESASSKCLTAISQGACTLDTSSYTDFPLPIIPADDPSARYTPTPEFVEGMIESFKTGSSKGSKLPKRIVWEILLGLKDIVDKEKSMTERTVDEGVVCDVIGDTHGVCPLRSTFYLSCPTAFGPGSRADMDPGSNSLTSLTFCPRSACRPTSI